jgi:hypothetical protein
MTMLKTSNSTLFFTTIAIGIHVQEEENNGHIQL